MATDCSPGSPRSQPQPEQLHQLPLNPNDNIAQDTSDFTDLDTTVSTSSISPNSVDTATSANSPDTTLSSAPSFLLNHTPARMVAGRRVLIRRLSPATPRPQPPLPPPLPNPDPALDSDDRASSSSGTSTSGHPPSLNPVSPNDPKAQSSSILCLSSAAAGDHSRQLLTVQVSLNGVPCTLLIDSGASRNFINTSFVDQHKLRLSSLRHPLRIRLADGTLSATAYELQDATVQLNDFSYQTSFVSTKLSGYDGILGKPFLDDVNPRIDWPTNTVTSPFVLKGNQLPTAPVSIQLIKAKRLIKALRKDPDLPLFRIFISEISEVLTATTDDPLSDPFSPSTTMSPEAQKSLHQLLSDRRSYFDEPTSVTTTGPMHKIHVKPGSTPPQHRLYRMSPAELEELQKQLASFLEKGWIRPSNSEYGAPVLFATKPGGGLRLCIDYRSLNAQTVKDRYPLPRTDELFDHLHGAKWFTKIDLAQGFHQMRMDPESIPLTSFNTRYGSYEFVVMPMGISNGPSSFMRLMNDVLRPYIDKFCVAFLDDVLIYSRSETEHLEHVSQVLDALNAANLKCKITKCSFAQESTSFLGFCVSKDGVSVDPKKVSAVTNWPLPHDLTSTRSFLGFTGFFRRFIKDYAKISAPLSSLTRSTVPFPSVLPQDAVDAFNSLKAALLSAPVLAIPFTGPDATFTLYTDASNVAIGAVLLQDQGNGDQPICYESRKLSPAEKNYAVHELELLAIVHAVKVFRHYLEGCKHFTLYTDHHSLKYFFTQRDLSRRQARWAQDLAAYQPNTNIVYRKGEENRADALSRLNLLSATSDISAVLLNQLSQLLPAHVVLSDPILDDIKSAYTSDPLYNADNQKRPSYLQLRNGIWYFKDRICVPNDPAIRQRILYEFHDTPTAGHHAYLKTLNAICAHFWWPRISRTVRSYCSSCATCQRIKPSTQSPPGLLQPHAVPSRPWSHISTDLVTDLPSSVAHDGHTYDAIVTFVCMLTKQAIFVRANKTITSQQLANVFIDHVLSKKGLPHVIVSDRDPRITSAFWQTLFAALGSKLNISTAHHPATDGQSEITHRSIEQILRAYVNPLHDDWSTWLPIAEFSYNNAVNSSTHQTPFFANYGFHPTVPISFLNPNPTGTDPSATKYLDTLRDIHTTIARELDLAKAQQSAQANRHRRDLTFQVGDRVRLSTDNITLADYPSSKLRPRYLGPFTVAKVVSPVSYRLNLPSSMTMHPVFHISRLLPWTSNPDDEFPDRQIPDQPLRSAREFVYGDTYLVDRILDCKIDLDPTSRARPKAPCLFFLVKWSQPYSDPSHDSWEPMRNLSKLDAFKEFISSPAWHTFTASDAYKSFALKYRSKIPKVVQFNLLHNEIYWIHESPRTFDS